MQLAAVVAARGCRPLSCIRPWNRLTCGSRHGQHICTALWVNCDTLAVCQQQPQQQQRHYHDHRDLPGFMGGTLTSNQGSLSEIRKDLNALCSDTWKPTKVKLNVMKKKYDLKTKIAGREVSTQHARMLVIGELAMHQSRMEVAFAEPILALPTNTSFASVSFSAPMGSSLNGLEALCLLGLASCMGAGCAGVGIWLHGGLQRGHNGHNKARQVAVIPAATNFPTERGTSISSVEQPHCEAAASASMGSSSSCKSCVTSSTVASPKADAACGTLELATGSTNMQKSFSMLLSFSAGAILVLLGVWWLGYCSSGKIPPSTSSAEASAPAAAKLQPVLSNTRSDRGFLCEVDSSAGVGVTAAKQAVHFFIGDLDDVTGSPRSSCGSLDTGVWSAESTA